MPASLFNCAIVLSLNCKYDAACQPKLEFELLIRVATLSWSLKFWEIFRDKESSCTTDNALSRSELVLSSLFKLLNVLSKSLKSEDVFVLC